MSTAPKWTLTAEEQQRYIDVLTGELAALRAKLGITQSELAYLVGISRQTYSAIENGRRAMLWSTYLSLLVFFDYNQPTRQMLRNCGVFPSELIERFNDGKVAFPEEMLHLDTRSAKETAKMLEALDQQGIQSLRTTLLVEYARCTGATKKMLEALEA